MAIKIITPDILELATGYFDALLQPFDQGGLAKPCELHYPPKMTRCNNCFSAGTMVSTPNGPIAIEKIKLGDLIYTPQGNIKPVINLFANLYSGKLYNICSNGIHLDQWATENHKYLILRNMRSHYTQKQWYDNKYILENPRVEEVAASDIRIGDAVIIPNHSINNINLDYFENDDFGKVYLDDDMLYLIGWWLAEGWGAKGKNARSLAFCLRASREKHIADKIYEIIYRKFNVKGKYVYRSDADNLVLYVHSTKLLKLFSVFGVGAETKNIPGYIWSLLSQRQKDILFKSYHCGDGHIANNNQHSIYNKYSITTISKILAHQIYQYLYDSNLTPSIKYYASKIDKNDQKHRDFWTVTWHPDRIQQKSGVRLTSVGCAARVTNINTKLDTIAVYNITVQDDYKYIANFMAVNNCIVDPIGKKSSNKYLNGGPIPFQMGFICPGCGGQGFIAQEVTELVYFTTEVIPKQYFNLPMEVNLPDGLLKIKGFLVDLPKLQRADHMLHNTAIAGYIDRKYKVAGEPLSPSNIVQNRYFTCLMTRIQ